jgi:two-component system NarL family sensor kinase
VSDSRRLDAGLRRHSGRAEQGIAWLRLAAVGLLAAAERLPPGHDYNAPFFSVLGAYALWSVLIIVISSQREFTSREGLVVVAVDVLVITGLSMLSGGPFSLTRLGYFIVPVTVAFRYRPALTLTATAVVIGAFVVQPLLDIGPDRTGDGGVISFVAVYAGMLAWVGLACTALSAAIARRTDEIKRLVADREHLLAEALSAESRERRALADGLHDGAVQSLLAIRHDLEDVAAAVRPGPDTEALERADEGLLGVVRDLRSAIFELHPHVLDEAGLEAALRQVAEVAARRAGFTLELELDPLSARADADRLLFSVARELLTNVVKHAGATQVSVTLRELRGERVLSVRDDGRGLDSGLLAERVSQGHIGLASQRVRLETAGGSLEVAPAPDGGTLAIARLPA